MPDPVDIGTRRELFVDDLLIAQTRDARLELQRPERREAALVCDAPWEDNVAGFLSVLQEGDSVRLYYRAAIPDREHERGQIIALAESTDGGRSFTRPALGLVEFEGSKENNILQIGGPPHVPPAFLDTNPNCPPEQRYKGLSAEWQKLYAMCSPDGLRWRSMLPGPVEMPGAFDTVNTGFWDSVCGCYRSFTRYFEDFGPETQADDILGPRPTVVRAIQSSTSPDFVHWSPPRPHQYADAEDRMQLYTNSTVPCPGAEHIYLAFPNRYVQERILRPDHPYPGVNDALFMVSRDCVHWRRYLEAWVRPGLDERNWTERNNYPTWGIVQASESEWAMFISEHYRQPDAPCVMRRLSIRPHGFVSVRAGFGGGELLTRPLIFSGRELRLNYSTSAAGCILVEMQDESGKPIPGFALRDMEPMFGDELDAPVAWNEGGDMARLAGRPVRMRFFLKDADLFALRTV